MAKFEKIAKICPQKMKVINVGLGRTGTLSTYTALGKLGFQAHHMKSVFFDPVGREPEQVIEFWIHCFKLKQEGRKEELLKLLKSEMSHFTASCDHPTANFYEELAELYPDAVFILNVRDSPEAWAKSVHGSIRHQVLLNFHPFYNKFIYFAGAALNFPKLAEQIFKTPSNNLKFPDDWSDLSFLAKHYVDRNQEVRNFFKSRKNLKFIEFNVKQGWEPICQILNLPVPDQPFPRVNDTQDQLKMLANMKRFCLGIFGVFVCSGLALYCQKFYLGAGLAVLPFAWRMVMRKFLLPIAMKKFADPSAS